jgi:hypothetical protein
MSAQKSCDSGRDRDGEDREDGLSAQASQSGAEGNRPKRYYAKSSNEESILRKQLSNERADTAILVEAAWGYLGWGVHDEGCACNGLDEKPCDCGLRAADDKLRTALSKIQSRILIRGDGDEG